MEEVGVVRQGQQQVRPGCRGRSSQGVAHRSRQHRPRTLAAQQTDKNFIFMIDLFFQRGSEMKFDFSPSFQPKLLRDFSFEKKNYSIY